MVTKGAFVNVLDSCTLLWSTLAVAAATFAIPFLGGPSALFGFVPLSATELGAIVIIVGAYIVATEIAKMRFFRRDHAPQVPASEPRPTPPFRNDPRAWRR